MFNIKRKKESINSENNQVIDNIPKSINSIKKYTENEKDVQIGKNPINISIKHILESNFEEFKYTDSDFVNDTQLSSSGSECEEKENYSYLNNQKKDNKEYNTNNENDIKEKESINIQSNINYNDKDNLFHKNTNIINEEKIEIFDNNIIFNGKTFKVNIKGNQYKNKKKCK